MRTCLRISPNQLMYYQFLFRGDLMLIPNLPVNEFDFPGDALKVILLQVLDPAL